MKIRIGCSVNDYLAGKDNTVIASWSLGFEGSGCTVGKAYEIKGISPTRFIAGFGPTINLMIENDNGEIKEYAPVHFSPCI